MNEPISFVEQIQNGNIEVIDKDVLVIENYPMGFKTCQMTFKKANNRNGQIIERTSLFNNRVSKPKKTTSCSMNIFIYDKTLKRHFIIAVNGIAMCIYTTAFMNDSRIYKEYFFNGGEEHKILVGFFKNYLKITEQQYQKLIKLI